MLESIMLFTTGSVLCVSINSFIMGLAEVLLGKVCGLDVLYFKYMFYDLNTVDYVNNEKKISFGKFSAICQHMIWQPDASKRNDKKERRFTWIHLAVDTVIEIILIIIMLCVVNSCKQAGNTLVAEFFIGVFYTLVVFTVLRLITGIRIMLTLDKHLGTYWRNALKQWTAGVPLEELSIPPYKELSLISPDYEIVPYENTRFMQKVWMDRYDELAPIVEEIEKYIKKSEGPAGYLKTYTNAYYNLIFYYSFIKTDNKRSTYYYNAVSKDLENDTDSNGRRVLAYYYYYIYKDASRAGEMIDAAWKVLPQFSIGQGERDYEAKLLNKLTEIIDNNGKI